MARVAKLDLSKPNPSRPLLRRVGGRLSRKFGWEWHPGYPKQLQIVPANACNFRCKACPKSVYETDNRLLAKEVYLRVREQILPYVREVNLQGLGEPMLSPLFLPMMRDAAGFGHLVRFVTNASRFDEENVREIVATRSEMQISIDGATAKTHEDSRPGAKFPQQMEALAMLKRHMDTPARHPGFMWSISTVVTVRNLDEIEGILDIGADHGAWGCTLIAPGMGDRKDDFAMDTIIYHEALFRARVPAIVEHARKRGIQLFLPPYITHEAQPKDSGAGAAPAGGSLFPQKCHDPWETIYVDVDGWIRPCCRAIWLGMGNILEQDFLEIWNNKHYRTLRRHINSDCPPEFCRGCTTHWGITGGDTEHVNKLEARGITLAPAPKIGVIWDKGKNQVI